MILIVGVLLLALAYRRTWRQRRFRHLDLEHVVDDNSPVGDEWKVK